MISALDAAWVATARTEQFGYRERLSARGADQRSMPHGLRHPHVLFVKKTMYIIIRKMHYCHNIIIVLFSDFLNVIIFVCSKKKKKKKQEEKK